MDKNSTLAHALSISQLMLGGGYVVNTELKAEDISAIEVLTAGSRAVEYRIGRGGYQLIDLCKRSSSIILLAEDKRDIVIVDLTSSSVAGVRFVFRRPIAAKNSPTR